MRLPCSAVLLASGLCAASPMLWAQSVSFTITGTIQAVVCTPVLSGSGYSGTTLTLQEVQMTALDQPAKTAGDRTVTFTLTNCGFSTATNNMWVHFTSGAVEAGRIVTNNAQVQFEIMDVLNSGATGNQVHVGGSAANTGPSSNQGTAAPFTGSYPSRNAVKNYIVRYYAKQAVTQTGTVTATATYTVKYF